MRARAHDGAWGHGRRGVCYSPRGERFPAKLGRTGFRRNFPYGGLWRGRPYGTKQLEAYAVHEAGDWLVLTVLVKYF